MTGAECLLRTLAANGVDVCFMNPGTSEMHFVSALDRVREVRGVLGLFEGVCAGAADGYARMTGKPAATLLHLGPGLANALSNLHNARKARSPVVNIVGEHSTQHLRYDAPLSADIEAFARTVSGYVRVVKDASEVGRGGCGDDCRGRSAAGSGRDADRAGRSVLVGIVERCPGGGSCDASCAFRRSDLRRRATAAAGGDGAAAGRDDHDRPRTRCRGAACGVDRRARARGSQRAPAFVGPRPFPTADHPVFSRDGVTAAWLTCAI